MRLEQSLRNRAFALSTLVGFLMLFVSLVIVYFSTTYATESSSNSVTDIILSNTRVYDVALIFVYGALATVIFSALVLIFSKHNYIPFTLKSISFLLVIRSMFVSLTHISPYPSQALLSDTFLNSTTLAQMFFTGDDLFFSGHVGLTYMMALIFWNTQPLRYTYFAISILFAVVVLLGHLHYSIDVFAAFFITYSIYVISRDIFKRDYEWTLSQP